MGGMDITEYTDWVKELPETCKKSKPKLRSKSDIFYCMTDYWDFVQQIRLAVNETGVSYYGWENKRAELHDDLCRALDVPKEQTKEITGNLDKFSRVEEFWDAMLQLKKQYETSFGKG